MRWLLSLVSLAGVLVLAVATLYRLGSAGVGEGGADWLESLPSAHTEADEPGILYRWRDAHGTLHIESSPPPLGAEDEPITDLEAIAYSRRAPVPAATESSARVRRDVSARSGTRAASQMPLGAAPAAEGMDTPPAGGVDVFEWLERAARQLEEHNQRLEKLKEQL